MKKFLAIFLLLTSAALFLAGCTSLSEASSNTATVYRDGRYTVYGLPDEMGWTPELTIVIEDNRITEAKYDERANIKKSLDTEYHKSFNVQTGIDYPAVLKTLRESLVASQDITMVDAVAGATNTSDNFKALVSNALLSAKDGNISKDGNYLASGTEDDKGWTPYVSITIENGKISDVIYDEKSSKVFLFKSSYTLYQNQYAEQSGINLTEVYDTLENALISVQTPSAVDAVTGATETHRKFTQLAEQALEQSKKQ
ncbi:MAG: FMN-binding protein [Bacillota bacterium]